MLGVCVDVGHKLTRKYFSVKLGVLGGVQLYTDPFLLWMDWRLADAVRGFTSPLSNGLKEEKVREQETVKKIARLHVQNNNDFMKR